ncbi:MAG: hypothetical protein CMJ78_22785 [Planctomycetaceae bacterium]|nr:hypothetical protein [Planctomycetaceae bacterium]
MSLEANDEAGWEPSLPYQRHPVTQKPERKIVAEHEAASESVLAPATDEPKFFDDEGILANDESV